MPEIRIDRIMEMLPHRYPLLLIDRVLHYDVPKKTITCLKNISVCDPFLQGHFPEKPIMPGVLQIEAMAQACGILLILANDNNLVNLFSLTGVNNARFRKAVLPGDQLIIEVNAIKLRPKSSSAKFQVKLCVDKKIVSEAEITLIKFKRE